MQQPVCAERLVSAVDAAEAEGFTWNAVGCSFPPSWPFDSDASQLIRNFTLFTGSPYQRMVEDILLRHDHMNASRARLRCEAQADPLLRGLACDGFAQTHDWGLPVAFVEAIAREAYATLDARVEAKGHDIAVLSSNARLRTLESPQGQRWIRNSSLLHAAAGYLGASAEVSGYEMLRLSNSLRSTAQYTSGNWHHDRCGARLKAFLYLHDVSSAGSRPTQVARGSHNTLYWSYHEIPQTRFSASWVARNYDVVSLGGPKGGGFVFDTNALHRGVVHGDSPRTLLVLEFNSVHKGAELSHAVKLHRYRHSFPCPSGAQRRLGQRVADLLRA